PPPSPHHSSVSHPLPLHHKPPSRGGHMLLPWAWMHQSGGLGPSCAHGHEEGRCGHTDYILVPDLLQINNNPCYWGVLNRFEAEELLEGQPEGTFSFGATAVPYMHVLNKRQAFSFDVRDRTTATQPPASSLSHSFPDSAKELPFSLQHLCRAVICSCTTYRGIDSLPLPPQLRDYLRQYHIKCDSYTLTMFPCVLQWKASV
uniref:Suppressor of cytokine signaling 4 n=1 Tax=Maylandia zebra TaxID=106582 RepID=A0A3P9DJM7_9CICH